MAKIEKLLDLALERRATELHLEIGVPPLGRIRGELVPVRDEPVAEAEMEPLLMEIVTLEQRSRILEDLDLDFSFPYGQRAWFRASYFHDQRGLGAVFRRVPTKIPALADLRVPEVVRELCERRTGLVLITGGARCGKSVTLAAMVEYIAKTRACHILCIDDPIEFLHEPQRALVTQREVGLHVPSFDVALRAAVRDDADVIAVGSFPSHATLRLAAELSSSGVLVIGTLTTKGAATTIDRILDDTPAEDRPYLRRLLSRTLAGIVWQQLVDAPENKRVPAVETLVVTPKVAALLRDGEPIHLPALVLDGSAPGTQTMDMALEKLVQERLITPDTALDRATDKDAFLRLGGKG